MVKKSIAAALLVAMVAWAEMAMVPMIIMRAGHMHAAREMAEHKAAHHHAMPAGHRCCPGIGSAGNAVPLEFAASGLPCQEQHRCCFQQGPQSVPAPATAGHRLSQEIALAEIAQLTPTPTESHVSPAAAVALGSPPSLMGMVLRV